MTWEIPQWAPPPPVPAKLTAAGYVAANFAPAADYLLNGDGFKPGRSPLGKQWAGIFAELVEVGLMRKSSHGRYWWIGAKS